MPRKSSAFFRYLPRNVLGGNALSALCGFAIWSLLGDTWIAAAVAVSTSILIMQLTHTLHPPGATTALIAVIGSGELHALGWAYAFSRWGPAACSCCWWRC